MGYPLYREQSGLWPAGPGYCMHFASQTSTKLANNAAPALRFQARAMIPMFPGCRLCSRQHASRRACYMPPLLCSISVRRMKRLAPNTDRCRDDLRHKAPRIITQPPVSHTFGERSRASNPSWHSACADQPLKTAKGTLCRAMSARVTHP
ncbi:hypothetical protein DPEC_G00108730 [Dallia pectoralis]|uniref:Uncharacterized protein n=1 Tax=Dallia pectoralis TaxID=75939 RepID=A0ACC2GT38_DALPE|nr:hypothetical protein DPEC_G00108730 [Dallia pectoralis]